MVVSNKALGLNEFTNRLHNLVAEAASNIPMYRALYGENPCIKSLSDFKQLPVTGVQTFAELEDVSKAVRNPWEMLGPFAPWNMEQARFPLSVLHNKQDEERLIERLKWTMDYVGLQKNERIVFAVSPPHQYGVAELVDLLIFVGFQCQILQVAGQSPQGLQILLDETGTDTFFFATEQAFFTEGLPECVKTLVTFNHSKRINEGINHFDILHPDEIPLLAICQQPNHYIWLQDHFYLEESNDKTLMVTTLCHDFGPFIRYETGIRAFVDGQKLYLLDD